MPSGFSAARQETGHRPHRAVTAGRNHQPWHPVRPMEQLGQPIELLDRELLRHTDAVLVKCATGTRKLAAAA